MTVNGNGNNIDGSGTYPVTTDYGWAVVVYGGSEWHVVAAG